MADYISILNKAIAGLSDNNADNRQVIYQKARGAIDRKLRSMDPAPSEDAIAGQLAQLEEAINQVEGEEQLASLSSEKVEPVPVEAPTEVAAEPEPTVPPTPEPAPIVDISVPAHNPPAGFVDDIILIDGIGEKTREALEGEGIVGLSQVAAMSDAQLAAVTEKIGNPGFELTQEWKKQAEEMLSGTLPRSKTDQERLKKLKDERPEINPEPVVDPIVQSADAPTELANDLPSTASETTSAPPSEAPVTAEEPVAPAPDPAPSQPIAETPVAPDFETENSAPTAIPETTSTVDASAEPAGDVADEQKIFADAIAELTRGRAAEGASAVEPTANVTPSIPEQPQVAASAEADLRPSIDESLAGVSDAPASIGQIDGDPLAVQPGEDFIPESDFSGTGAVLKPKRSFGKTLGCAGLLALLGGAAYGGWMYQDQVKEYGGKAITAVQELFGSASNDAEPEPAPSNDTDAEDAAQSDDGKDDARLGTDDASESEPVTEDTVAEPDAGDGTQVDEADAPRNILAEPVQETPATVEVEGQDDPIAGESGNDGETQTDDSAAEEAQPSNDDNATDQTVEDDGATSETETPVVQPAIAAGESAFLYEEAIGATGANRDEGGIVWTLAQEAPEAGAPPEAVIKGLVEIPARGLKLNMSIKRNVDPGLPASHIIELLFTAPADFSGGNIDNVSRFVMKASEQARGESLVGVPARIDAGFFLIALNNLDQAQQTNIGLLENGQWIDIPVAYVTGRRGLITLAKGEAGRKVFADALADWRNR